MQTQHLDYKWTSPECDKKVWRRLLSGLAQRFYCTANYRPVLSSEKASHFEVKKFSDEEKKRKKSGHGPQRSAPHQDRLVD
jgi:hypothetical protein